MRITTKLSLATGLSVAIACSMIASIAWTQLQVVHAQKARDLVHEMLTVQTERELARNDFIIRRENRAIEQWKSSTSEFGRLLDSSAPVLDSKLERLLIADISSDFEATKTSFAALSNLSPVSEDPGGPAVYYDKADALLIGQMLIRAYSMHDDIYRLRELESAAVDSAVGRGSLIAIVVILLGTLAITLIYARLARHFAGRTLELQKGLAVIGSGDLAHRIQARGDDEFAELARASNAMAARLKESHASILELRSEIARREVAEDLRRRALEEKDSLLRELFHRTRNNMQIIMAILDAEAALAKDRQIDDLVRRTNGRIMSMALVHGKLYESGNLSTIDLSAYSRDLIGLLLGGQDVGDEKVRILSYFDSVSASIETAVPFGLAFHELVSNAMRHAYPAMAAGVIRVGLTKDASGTIELEVADDGVGLPEAIESGQEETLGLQLVHTLVEGQLKGRLWFENEKGLHWHASFEDRHGIPHDSK